MPNCEVCNKSLDLNGFCPDCDYIYNHHTDRMEPPADGKISKDDGDNSAHVATQCVWVYAHFGFGNMVFDCNGGVMAVNRWKAEIIPIITATIPRADGGFFPTHVWRLCARS